MSPSKPQPFLLDPTLPPLPPIRTNSSLSISKDSPTSGASTPTAANVTYSIPFGYGGMGVAPLSVVTKSLGIGSSSSSGGVGAQLTGASTPPTGEPQRETSSTARFKEMIKRNVGLSTPTSATSTVLAGPGGVAASINSSPTVGRTGSLLATNGGPKTTSMSTGAIGDLVSGDEQPSMFSVSRMTGRKKKLAKKVPNEGGSPLSDEDDMPLSMRDSKLKGQQPSPSSRHHHHHHRHRFMPHLSRHHSLHEQQLYPQLLQGQRPGGRSGQPAILKASSKALREARESNLDPNVLVAELEPLPAKFFEAMIGLSGESPWNATLFPSAASTMQPSTTAAAANLAMIPLLPMMTSIIPSISTSAHPLSERKFLFKSYQNSKFQGYYAFRIHGDQVEFGKLPVAFEQACSLYFREADVSFRFLEKMAKDWRDQRKEALAEREKMQERYRRIAVRSETRSSANRSHQASQEQLKPERPKPNEKSLRKKPSSLTFDYDSAICTNGVPSRSSSRTGARSRSSSVSRIETGSSSSLFLPFGITKGDTNQPQPAQADPVQRILLDRHPLLGNENTLTQSPPSMSVNNSQEDISQVSDTSTAIATTNNSNGNRQHHRSNFTGGGGRVRSYSDPTHPDKLILLLDDEIESINNPPTTKGPYYNELDDLLAEDEDTYFNLPAWRQKELRERQEMQWAVDDDYWQKVECQYSIESRTAQYGLEQCLQELIQPVDYEPFDYIHQVEIRNENRDATMFSITNVSKSNEMWLESPSPKFKYEFFNWIAISLMDHGGSKQRRQICIPSSRTGSSGRRSSRGGDGQENMRTKREQIMDTMKNLEDVLGQLENLDESAKKLSLTMLRTIENDEVQSALLPSPATELTLAETVNAKMRDVNERIVVCARIMGAARFNLNRLKYEIELEHRSIRLFRQYKIAIAVVTVSILLLFWLLYYHRHAYVATEAE
ncbi:hypothetical protein BGZ96_001980, partial [Linnemannia gamsii]